MRQIFINITHQHREKIIKVTIASRSRQIGRKLQARTRKASTPSFNIAPETEPSITLGLTQEDSEDEDDSLLGR